MPRSVSFFTEIWVDLHPLVQKAFGLVVLECEQEINFKRSLICPQFLVQKAFG